MSYIPKDNGENINRENKKTYRAKKRKRFIFITSALIFIAILIILLRRDAPPILEISPINLNFGDKQTEMEFTIKNAAKAEGFFRPDVKNLNFEIESKKHPNWLTIKPVTGAIKETPEKISVKVDRNIMPYGSSMDELRILTNAGDAKVRILVQKSEERLTLISPAASTSISVGDNRSIEWTATSGVSESVNIFFYSKEEKIGTIADNYNFRKDDTSKGSFTWKVDDFIREGDDYAIRIEDAGNRNVRSPLHNDPFKCVVDFLLATLFV